MRWRRWFARGLIGLGLIVLAWGVGRFYTAAWTGFAPKVLWDWLELLLIPAVLTGGGIWFTRSENRQAREIEERRLIENRRIEEERLKEARAIEEKRLEETRAIEHDRAQDATVKDYLDQMTELLLTRGLRTSLQSEEVRSVARARTLLVLRSIDRERKSTIVQFLYESGLIGYRGMKENVCAIIDIGGGSLERVSLRGALLDGASFEEVNLESANLSGAQLGGANLGEARLFQAHLSNAYLAEAQLIGTNLEEAHLYRVDFEDADLSRAYLIKANLSKACLLGANLRRTDLYEAQLNDANLTLSDLSEANLIGANLIRANLTGANLSWASLKWACLSGAHLKEAQLCGATCDYANLTNCNCVTLDQLLQAQSLHGAILPNHIDPADLGDKWSPPEDKTKSEP